MSARLNTLKLHPTDSPEEQVLLQVQQDASKDFYYKVLPKTGYKCVFIKRKDKHGEETTHHYWFKSRKAAIRFIISHKTEKNEQVYVAQASFQEKGTEFSGRTKANSAFLKNLFDDIDSGAGKPYGSQAEGKTALLSFCQRTGLPVPAIVNSGIGLYAHWVFTREVAVADWTVVANKLQKLVRALEPGLDADNLIPDSARVLRPVGAIHRKDPSNPKTVTLVQDCKPLKFEALSAIIDKALAALPATPAKSVAPSPHKAVVTNNNISDQHSTSSAIRIAERCGVLSHFRDTKGNVSEPIWHASTVLLVHCLESPGIIHDWSSGHPDYSREQTDAKIAQCTTPPTTCSHFSGLGPDICSSCEHNGKINTPIVLGYTKPVDVIPDFVQEMNKDRFVGCIGGKTLVFREVFDEALSRFILETSSFQDIRNLFNNQKVVVGTSKNNTPITVPLGSAWLDHEFRRQYFDIKMLPEGCSDEKVYNLFRGFAVEPVKGVWTLMRKHIKDVICSGDKNHYRYVIRWLARMIQKPWTPGEVALVLQGGKGVGKGMLGNAICRIMGQHACHVMNVKHVTGDFNAHLEDCIFLFADEAFWAGDKAAEGVLKGMITESTILIVRKYCDGKQARNMLHVFMASNNDWVVPASKDERRYCVLKVSDCHKDDFPYFKALATETDNGGLAALLYYLQNLDISDFEVRAVPKTEGLAEQKIQSLDTVLAWWFQKLSDGELLPGCGWGSVPVKALYDDYIASVQQLGGNVRRVTVTYFALQLRKILPSNFPVKSRHTTVGEPRRVNHYNFPDLNTCRTQFETVLGIDGLDWQ